MEERQKNEEYRVSENYWVVASFAIGVLSLLLIMVGGTSRLFGYMLIGLVLGLVSMALGIIGFVVDQKSKGKRTGKGYAIFGFLLPAFIFFLGILLPAFTRVRSKPIGSTCGTNLAGLGKAMMLYANDYQDELPKAGGKDNTWVNRLPDWTGGATKAMPEGKRLMAYDMANPESSGKVTLSSSLYLLIKHAECTPKMFVCKGEKKTKEFSPSLYKESKGKDMQFLWDFGPEPWRHYSYSYHIPFGAYALTTSAETGTAVLADRNPWIAWPGGEPNDFTQYKPDIDPWKGTVEEARYGNSPNHKGDGQNVLYMDSHVDFKKRSFCGIDKDNIYTRWDGEDRIRGIPPDMNSQPADKKDSLLVNDPPAQGIESPHGR